MAKDDRRSPDQEQDALSSGVGEDAPEMTLSPADQTLKSADTETWTAAVAAAATMVQGSPQPTQPSSPSLLSEMAMGAPASSTTVGDFVEIQSGKRRRVKNSKYMDDGVGSTLGGRPMVACGGPPHRSPAGLWGWRVPAAKNSRSHKRRGGNNDGGSVPLSSSPSQAAAAAAVVRQGGAGGEGNVGGRGTGGGSRSRK